MILGDRSGPGGGDASERHTGVHAAERAWGRIIAEGVPEVVAEVAVSATGQYLRPILERASIKPIIADVPVKRPKRPRKVEPKEPELIAAK